MNIWLTTDTHFGHDILKQYCGRPDGFEDKILNGLLNAHLGENDLLIHLGDFCIGNDADWHEKFIHATFSAKRWLLRGNHDHKSNSYYMKHGWDFVGDVIKDTYFGKKICFSHVPQYWDGWYDINIHGHFHNSDHRRHEEELVWRKNGYQKLLALEYINYQPIKLESFII